MVMAPSGACIIPGGGAGTRGGGLGMLGPGGGGGGGAGAAGGGGGGGGGAGGDEHVDENELLEPMLTPLLLPAPPTHTNKSSTNPFPTTSLLLQQS